jgi:hypothetical protein
LAYGSLPPILAVRIRLFRLRLLLQLIEQLPACRGRQRQYPRRYRHHLVVERTMAKVSGHVGLNSRVYRCERSAIEDEDSCDNCEREGNGASALAPQSSSRPRRFPDFRQSIGFGLCQRGWAIKNERRRSNLSFEDCMHRGKVRFEKEIEKPKAALISSFLMILSPPVRGRLCALPQVPHLSAAA